MPWLPVDVSKTAGRVATNVRSAKTQISVGTRPVWSESSLSAWRTLGSLATHWAHSEDFDQTRRMPRLISVFAERTCYFVGFVMLWENRWKCADAVHIYPEGTFSHCTAHFYLSLLVQNKNTVDSRYLEVQGTLWTTSRYPYIHTATYQNCRIEEKINRTTTFNKCICDWTLEIRDILKILRSNFSSFPQYFITSC